MFHCLFLDPAHIHKGRASSKVQCSETEADPTFGILYAPVFQAKPKAEVLWVQGFIVPASDGKSSNLNANSIGANGCVPY